MIILSVLILSLSVLFTKYQSDDQIQKNKLEEGGDVAHVGERRGA
jgi:hypothetical protein